MKILFIAPIPPPIDGQSKASRVLLDRLLQDKHSVNIVNLSKKNLKNGYISLIRVFYIFKILIEIWKKRNKKDIIYLSIAESFLGNIRDIIIYAICRNDRQKIFIHMLGGAGMNEILNGKGIQQKINKYFIGEIGGVIVEGPINFEIFSKVISKNKIHIIPNFAEDFLFANDSEIKIKFSDISKLQILFLSNLLPGKGYNELAEAFIALNDNFKNQINITFVGGFESIESEKDFLKKIKSYSQLRYLGRFIDGEKKRELYLKSHIFCLPTYYPFEGQPISILEAYATGCVVISSDHSGIPFIFTNKKNGYMVTKKSVQSIKEAIEMALINKNKLEQIAVANKNEALEKYRTSIYQDSILKIFKHVN